MGQWAPLEQGWGSSVRKPTEMRPGRAQNEHPWPPKTLTIAGEVLRKSMLEALRQKLWPRLPPKAALEEPRGPTLQNHRENSGFEDLAGGGTDSEGPATRLQVSDFGRRRLPGRIPKGIQRWIPTGIQLPKEQDTGTGDCCSGVHTPWAQAPGEFIKIVMIFGGQREEGF